MKLSFQTLSIGKTDRRNDDFCFAVNLFQYQALGVIGDFTSDSPQGASEACRSNLVRFIEERIQTWREMLLGPDRLIPLILRHTNDWLADYRPKAQTTLIVFLWDLQSERCHFLSVGDSGLAVAGPQGLRFLREGDRTGLRISAGFLPGQPDLRIEVARVARDETLCAFTDGLWENTSPFLNDDLLLSVLREPSLAAKFEALQQRVLQPATRKDDLTLLIMTEEGPMKPTRQNLDSAGESLDPQLKSLIERHLEQALGASRMDAAPSPLQRDLLKLLGDAPALEQRLVETLAPQLVERLEARLIRHLEDQAKAFGDQLRQVENQFQRQLADQQRLIQALEQRGEGSATKSTPMDRSKPGSKTPTKELVTNQGPSPNTGRGAVNPKITADPDKKGIPVPLPPWAFIVGIALLVAILGLGLYFSLRTHKQQNQKLLFNDYKNQAQELKAKGRTIEAIDVLKFARSQEPNLWTEEETMQLATWEDELKQKPAMPDPPKPPVVAYVPAVISVALLDTLATDQATYTRQTADIQAAIDGLVRPIKLPSDATLVLENSKDLVGGTLKVQFSPNALWANKTPVSKERVAKIWFQAFVGVSEIDGSPGSITKELFLKGRKPEAGVLFDEAMKAWEDPK